MMRDEFRHLILNMLVRCRDSDGDIFVDLPALAAQHALIDRIPKQLVSEPILKVGVIRCADEAALDEPDERLLEIY
jgi:hypothetical protein